MASTAPALRQAHDMPGKPGAQSSRLQGSIAERRNLRRIPALHDLSPHDLEQVREQLIRRSYQAGEVIWRTHEPLRFNGYVQSGEIELETRINGMLVRTTRLGTGDPLPQRSPQGRRPHEILIARAVTDVQLAILPDILRVRPVSGKRAWRAWAWFWPVLLVLLVIILAWSDIARITSGLFYLVSTRDDVRSMSLLQVAQKVDQGAAFAYNEEGYRWFLQDRLPDASRSFDEAVSRDPANAPALNNLAVTDFLQGNIFQAVSRFQQATQANPDSPIARYNLGVTLMQLADPTGALREFQEAGFIDPTDVSSLLQQAYLYLQEEDFANAEQRARSAIQLNPSLPQAHLLLGMALYNQGREADALASFDQALALKPGNRVAAFYQALILGHQKKYDAALPVLYGLLTSSQSAAETARILAEIDALYHFRKEPAAAGP